MIKFCQTELEGINYTGTCTDGLDNNCNGLIDDNLYCYKFFAIGWG